MLIYSEREKAQAKTIAEWLRGKSSSKTIRRILKSNGFKWIGSGLFKITYHNPAYPTLVVKVYRSSSDSLDDTTKGALTAYQARFFLTPVVHNNHFIIQKKFNKKGGNALKASNFICNKIGHGVHDVSSHNCCYHDGRPYFFDYCS